MNLPQFQESFGQIIDSISLLKLQLTEVQQKIKQMEKNIKKELKNVDKINNKKKTNNKKTKMPSGFAKPTLVTKQLCEFMNRPVGTEIARTEVNKQLIKYIKNNNLQDKNNKTVIIPDNTLKNLLGIIENEMEPPLTFFTLQKYMNKHFISTKHNNNNIDQQNNAFLHSSFC